MSDKPFTIMGLQNRPFNLAHLEYTTSMLKSIFFTLLILNFQPLKAEQTLKYLATSGSWKDYIPENFNLLKKLGPSALTWSTDAPAEDISDEKLITRDPYLIFKPNTTIAAKRITKTGLRIYDVKYSFDASSRRFTKKNTSVTKKNLILLGCSFTLGSGLNDSETFSFYLSELRPDYNVYNLGIYGAGANDILDDLKSFKRFEDIPKTRGIVLYTAIFDHIERTTCTLNCYRTTYKDWVLKKSNYVYDEKNQQLNRIGSFDESRPIKGLIFNLMANIRLFDKVNIPQELSDSQIVLYIQMLLEIKKISKEKLNSDFYFTFYPGGYEYWDKIKAALSKNNIKYLDLSKIDLKAASDNRNYIILDGHPTKLANYLYANLVHYRLPY
jgi:hypothetical protein